MKAFTVITDYLEHEGGTKFYECVAITEVGGDSLLIKRFGAISAKMGGGQVRFYSGWEREVDYRRQTIVGQKCCVRAGQGKYVVADRPQFGLHEQHLGKVSSFELYRALQRHYSGQTFEYLLSLMGLEAHDSDASLDGAGLVQDKDLAASEVRSSSWGSW